jgi:nitrite reductase/ring-hydroxylating ferredoxin subunit
MTGRETEATGTLIDVCSVDELTSGEIYVFDRGKRPNIGLTRVRGEVRAFGLICPHKGARLERGGRIRCDVRSLTPGEMELDPERPVLTCPWHNWEYSLEDGRALFDTRRRLRMFPAVIDAGRVLVRLED